MASSVRAAPLAHRQPKTHGSLTPYEWAQIIAEEARTLGVKMTPKQIAEGIGTLEYESSGSTENFGQGAGGHIGAWAESPTFGSTQERMNARASTRAAIKNWLENGKSWWPAWGRWQAEQRPDGQAGETQWKKYIGDVERALGGLGPGAQQPRVGVPGPGSPSSSSGSGGLAGDLMNIGLVAALVVGGVSMVGLGVTRVFGTAKRAAPA